MIRSPRVTSVAQNSNEAGLLDSPPPRPPMKEQSPSDNTLALLGPGGVDPDGGALSPHAAGVTSRSLAYVAMIIQAVQGLSVDLPAVIQQYPELPLIVEQLKVNVPQILANLQSDPTALLQTGAAMAGQQPAGPQQIPQGPMQAMPPTPVGPQQPAGRRF